MGWARFAACFCLLFWFCPYNYTVEVRNRLKGLDLIDRVPDELWMEVCDIVQETRIKTIARNAKKQNGYLGRPYK